MTDAEHDAVMHVRGLPPGPELDALVATRVMGWRAFIVDGLIANDEWVPKDGSGGQRRVADWKPSAGFGPAFKEAFDTILRMPAPTTGVPAGGAIVEGPHFNVASPDPCAAGTEYAGLWRAGWTVTPEWDGPFWMLNAWGVSMPHAVCQAAVLNTLPPWRPKEPT